MDKFLGKRLDGRYELKEIIGVGGMAVVYKAYDNIEDRIVAVKILKEEFSSNEEFLRRFKNESKAIAVLSHPNIVKVFDVSFGDLIQYIVMEYIDGITLKEFIEQQRALRWKDAVHFTIQILRALQHAHDKGIVHRDVKPQNIMLLPDGKIKVTDFGIARFARSEHQTVTDKTIGSVHYISPEQARGDVTDEKSDLYSIGIMLYEMLTGELPFEAENAVSVAIMQLQNEPKGLREINSEIPLGLEQITMKAMQKDSLKRYQTAAEMLCDLEEFRRDPEMLFEHNYFMEEESIRLADQDENDDEEAPQKPPVIPILAGVASALVLVLAILAVLFLPKLFSGSSSSFACPNLVGKKYDDLTTSEEYQGLNIKVDQIHSSEVEAGYIMDQDPKAGRNIKPSQTITITVSLGAKQVTVPDVYEIPEAEAVSTLKANNFKVDKTIEITDEFIAKGSVVKTEPARNTNVPEGTAIILYISSGAEVKMGKIPSLTGLSVDVAKRDIEQNGFKVGEVNEVNSTLPKGIVIAQRPDISTSTAPRGSAIDIDVSNGVAPEYTCNVSVQFIDALSEESGKLEIRFSNGDIVKEENINYKGSYDFKYRTTYEKTLTAEVYLYIGNSEMHYQTLSVDAKNNKVSVTKTHYAGE
ncbi:MAG: protein kinase [Clostridia bacterium]|nr:protein kinase [Clostridia bacterium]MBQ7289078.1 protein kinase [Clostridia bacterium]